MEVKNADNTCLRIAITLESPIDNEAEMINFILSSGWNAVHLRHPDASKSTIMSILDKIAPEYLHQVKIHDHFNLSHLYPIGGLHLNRRNNQVPDSFYGELSRSCHSVDEIKECNGYSYVTLSPIFNSISKAGYRAASFDLNSLLNITNKRIIALGGITPERLEEIKRYNFSGIAVSGYLFRNLGNDWLPELKSRLENFNK